MSENYDWLEVKTPRSVDQLRLWADNPRLNPEGKHISVNDFVKDFISGTERIHFMKLIKSIATEGFIPADPIIVWKNETNQKYYVAEGNRRVAALKLLRNPGKAPKSIRGSIRKYASQIEKSSFKKIKVNVAPSFEDAEWYINQRNSVTSLNRFWSREQQQRWISGLYDKYQGDLSKIQFKTGLTQSELEQTIRFLKIKDFIKLPEVNRELTQEELKLANSHRFPMTVLERFLSMTEFREQWGIEYDGVDVKIVSNKQSFYKAFAALIKQIIANEVSTRFTKDKLPAILDTLPHVSLENTGNLEPQNNEDDQNAKKPETNIQQTPTPPNDNIRDNPYRKKLVPSNCQLITTNHKLEAIFKELESLCFTREYSISIVLRVFFDLSVLEYIESEGMVEDIEKHYNNKKLQHVTLKQRLEYLKKNNKLNQNSTRVVGRLLNPNDNHYSLDTLNGYIHGKNTHYVSKQFLNGFWDFLYPLFEQLLDIKENK